MAVNQEKTIIAPTTDAKVAENTFNVGVDRPCSVFVSGLAGAEEAALEYTLDNGNTFVAAADSNGPIVFTATDNSKLVEGPGKYSISKDATVGAVGAVVVG
jgi:hypothetical protein